jgi:glycosyltransferase involved in cell wall biosynthesis
MKPRILHLSADYPDQFESAKTRAIQGLVEGTADQFDHLVVSLNRKGGVPGLLRPGSVTEADLRGAVLALRYTAPPAALAIAGPMAQLADWLTVELARRAFKPDLIQAHKLTIEGLIARRLASRLKVPFALTLQGNTDQKLLRQRPDRGPIIRQVWREAQGIMAFAPWTAKWCTSRLGPPQAAICLNPCLLPHDAILPPVIGPTLIRTAFNLDFWRNKNVETLLAAVDLVARDCPDVRLEIAGQGSDLARTRIAGVIAKLGLSERVTLAGPIAPDRIQSWFNGAAVFALPSRRESYGMVFAESLLGGTPVLFSRGTAIDGYFDQADFARAVNAEDGREIAAVLVDMLKRNKAIKAQLATEQTEHAFDFMKRDGILATYRVFLEKALT